VWETDSVSDAQSVTSSMSRSGGGTAPVMSRSGSFTYGDSVPSSRSGSFTYGDSVPVAIAIEP
jgi:hypothetical protein